MPVLPIPNPMDEVRGGKMFWRKLNSRFRGVRTRTLGSYNFLNQLNSIRIQFAN